MKTERQGRQFGHDVSRTTKLILYAEDELDGEALEVLADAVQKHGGIAAAAYASVLDHTGDNTTTEDEEQQASRTRTR